MFSFLDVFFRLKEVCKVQMESYGYKHASLMHFYPPFLHRFETMTIMLQSSQVKFLKYQYWETYWETNDSHPKVQELEL